MFAGNFRLVHGMHTKASPGLMANAGLIRFSSIKCDLAKQVCSDLHNGD